MLTYTELQASPDATHNKLRKMLYAVFVGLVQSEEYLFKIPSAYKRNVCLEPS